MGGCAVTYSQLCEAPIRDVHRLGKWLGVDVARREGEPAGEYIRRLRVAVWMAVRRKMLVGP